MSSKEKTILFNQFRKTLIIYTQEAQKCVSEISSDAEFKPHVGDTVSNINHSLSILEKNDFPITLLAKFQAGKSTTTAVMADGREITPCGKGGGGLRTSTISVTIYNDDDVPTVTYEGKSTTPVTINLYSKTELVKTILEAAGTYLSNQNETLYDLDNPEHREILKKAIEKEIESYCKNKNYDNDKITILRDAALIIHFYGCDAYKKLCAGGYSTILGIQPFLKVEKWEAKWADFRKEGLNILSRKNKNSELDFKAEECLHVFVENIRIPVHSKFMAETGTSVTDSPGTMANLRDTQRALKAANESAVIVFVLNGNKEFSQEEKNQLQKLRNSGMAEKVVFAINYSQNPDTQQSADIENAIVKVIDEQGYNAPHHQHPLHFNAYLALHAYQAQKLLTGDLDDLSKNGIIEDARKSYLYKKDKNGNLREPTKEELNEFYKKYTPNFALKKTTIKALRMIDTVDADNCVDELSDNGFTPNVIQEILNISNWETMIVQLREHIIKNRAAGVLLDLGVNPVLNATKYIEQILKSCEDSAEMDENEAKEEYEAAKALLEKYSTQVNELLEDNLTDYIDEILAEDYYKKVVIDSIDEATKEAAPKVYNETGIASQFDHGVDWVGTKIANGMIATANVFKAVGSIFSNSEPEYIEFVEHESIEQSCNNIMSKSYDYAVFQRGMNWIQNLETSNVYINQVKKPVLNIQNRLKNLWKELKFNENEFFKEIDPFPADLTGSMSKDAVSNDITKVIIDNPSLAAEYSVADLVKGIVAGVVTYHFTAFVYLEVLPATFIIPGIGQILLGVSAVVALITWLGTDDQERIDELQNKLAKEMKDSVEKEKQSIISNIIEGQPNAFPEPKPGLSLIRKFYTAFFKGLLDLQKKKLEDNYQQKLAELNMTREKREAIKKKAAQWRTQRIQPLHEKLDEVRRQIENVWSKGEYQNA